MSTIQQQRADDERTLFLNWIVEGNFNQLTKRVAPLCDCKAFSFQSLDPEEPVGVGWKHPTSAWVV